MNKKSELSFNTAHEVHTYLNNILNEHACEVSKLNTVGSTLAENDFNLNKAKIDVNYWKMLITNTLTSGNNQNVAATALRSFFGDCFIDDEDDEDGDLVVESKFTTTLPFNEERALNFVNSWVLQALPSPMLNKIIQSCAKHTCITNDDRFVYDSSHHQYVGNWALNLNNYLYCLYYRKYKGTAWLEHRKNFTRSIEGAFTKVENLSHSYLITSKFYNNLILESMKL